MIHCILSDKEQTIIDCRKDEKTFKQIANEIKKKNPATRKQWERLRDFIQSVYWYYFEFLTIKEIAEKLEKPVDDIDVYLRRFKKRYDTHYTAAFKKLSSKNKEIINLRVDKKMDFPTIAEKKR